MTVGACLRVGGWLAVAALVAFSSVLLVTWNQQHDTRSADLHTASLEAPVSQALNLKPGKPDTHNATVTGDVAVPAPRITTASPSPAKSTSLAPPTPEIPAMKDWPRSVALKGTPDVRTITEDPKKDEFIYHTEHFEFCCDAPVGPDAVRHFARVFEATWMLNCMIPLDLRPAPETMRKWFRARILSTDEAYMATGAPAGSGGYYSRSDKTIYVPISSLGMKLVGHKRVMLDQSVESNDTLIHEITHQMMSRWLPRLPIWFAEGSAEYAGIADFVHGRFFLSGMESRLKNHLRSRGGQTQGGSLRFGMLKVTELLAMEAKSWAAGLESSSGTQNYVSALLLTYYLYHLDREKDSRDTIAWLRAIEQGQPSAEAFRHHILGGRTLAQFEAEFIRGYRQIGVELQFTRRGGPEFK